MMRSRLYKSLCDLLKCYPELIEDFAGFLRPEEAVECDCFSINQEYQRANEFLRKLEINFEKQPTQFQRILRCFDKWQKNVNKTGDLLKTQIRSLLRSSPILLQEFDMFFPDEKIPECHTEDYEEVNLSDNSDNEDDGFEEIDIPAEYDTYRTKRCPCDCHKDPNDTKLQARLKHCYDCCLKNVDGGLYFQTSKNKLQPVKVVFHKVPAECSSDDFPPTTVESPVSPIDRPGEKLSIEDKENEMSPPVSSVIQNTGESPLKHCSLKKAKKMKLKTDKNKAGEKRFLSLNEITSPVKYSTSDVSNLTSSVDTGTITVTNTIPTTTLASIPLPTFTTEDSNISLSTFLDPNKTLNINQDKPWATINENSSSDLLAKAVKGTIGNIASKPYLLNENSTADLLAAALKEAEIQRGDVSMDSNFFRMVNSPTKSQTGSAASVSGSQLSFSGAINPIYSDLLTQPNINTQTQSYSQPVTTTSLETITNVNSVIINTSELFPLTGISPTIQSSSGAMTTSVSDVNFPTVMSGTIGANKTLSKSDSANINVQEDVGQVNDKKEKSISDDVTWSREMDRIILEMCQIDGAKPETYQKISQKLVTKSPAEITERFKVLMELLTDSHDDEDSEEYMTE
ncbi:hypothetical protein LOTGIDRAFT_237967 [Lottia gigantea]|uniref:Myb-like domain-containing protein n=1 Tax=Lottia gigantea TaxID=225164 RepID=V4B9Z7_LOTGI|nr:hypothetical protein LOTGIDRAFT_237967 [Lottia gigantea]ESP02467.1 hypothetical protein LOTGIDRAFT_237967 [Lottia gigantea]